MANYDMRDIVGRQRPASPRNVQFPFKVDFSKRSLAAADVATVFTLPAGYVHDRLIAVSRTPEGEACTFDVGVAGTQDGFGIDLSANSAANTQISVGAATFAAGKYFHTNTDVIVTVNAAQPALNVAVIDFLFIGVMMDTV